ncbi:MAG: hypothetical protein AB1578_14750 [Thermodesulfobacteriota bacterium]
MIDEAGPEVLLQLGQERHREEPLDPASVEGEDLERVDVAAIARYWALG